ncbi:cyclic GMP-AMP synthase DncV-like nucleotidyltransferase [Streptomyces sp. NPDC048282]|uniref:SMODS domain-containing nucleotidyltransferase n=1 Tax=Streptomyces sp. NPDC048282 TaxID=3365528 RepID=UPI0037241E95
MQHVTCFATFLRDVINLSQAKLDLLDARVEAIYKALKSDPELGPLVLGKKPQGSWAQRTIINPQGDKEFDADFMLHLQEVLEWADDPATYIDKIYAALHRHSIYRDMPHTRKCRCVQLTYANSMHVDIVPYLRLSDGREVIVNRDENRFETTNPAGFTAWMKEKDDIANGNLRKVIRLMKYLRDHRNSFTGTRSVILTTLLGERVTQTTALLEPGCYANVPTALLTIVEDLDEWLQARPYKPSIPDPSQSGLTFDHRWDQSTYAYFRDRIHTHARQIRAAYDETDPETSVRRWRELFGGRFPEPDGPGSSSTAPAAGPKFPVPPLITPTRTGRAG